MVDAEDLPGGLKARAVLTQMKLNPPRRNQSRNGTVRQYVEGLYPELRAVREKGWSWKAITEALSKIDGFPALSKHMIPKVFAQVDREWEQKTGQKALSVRLVRKKRKAAKETSER